MTDLTKLNQELAKLGSKLEAFFGAQDPPIPTNEQPAVDACVKQVEAIMASIPDLTAKRPFVKPGAPVAGAPVTPASGPSIFAPPAKTAL